MSCYFRYIKDTLAEAGIEISASNKKQVDQIIHEIVGVEYKNCSKTWSKLKVLKQSETTWAEIKEKLKSRWAEIN